MTKIPKFTILPFNGIKLCNSRKIAILQSVKNGRFERAETVKIGGANHSQKWFCILKAQLPHYQIYTIIASVIVDILSKCGGLPQTVIER